MHLDMSAEVYSNVEFRKYLNYGLTKILSCLNLYELE